MKRLLPVFVLATLTFSLSLPEAQAGRKKDDNLGGILMDEVTDYMKNGTPQSICTDGWIFGDDLNRCIHEASTGVFDTKAVKFCHGLFGSKLECLETIKDKSYSFVTIQACEANFTDSGKIDCLRQNGTPYVAAKDMNEAVKNTIIEILWNLLAELMKGNTSTAPDAREAQRAHLLKMIGEIKGTHGQPAIDGVVDPDTVRKDGEAELAI